MLYVFKEQTRFIDLWCNQYTNSKVASIAYCYFFTISDGIHYNILILLILKFSRYRVSYAERTALVAMVTVRFRQTI